MKVLWESASLLRQRGRTSVSLWKPMGTDTCPQVLPAAVSNQDTASGPYLLIRSISAAPFVMKRSSARVIRKDRDAA